MHQAPDSNHRFPLVAASAQFEIARTGGLDRPASPQISLHLHFASLFHPGRALSFPCDRRGVVPLDELSERARSNYFFARTAIGRDYGAPTIVEFESGALH